VTKGSSPNWQGFAYRDQGIPFVRSQNVGWGVTDLSGITFLPPAFNEVEKKSVLREGDVLLNIVGASIGRAAIAPKTVEGGNVNQAVAVIRVLDIGVSNQFVLLHLLSGETQRRIHEAKVDVARANFSLEDIKQLPFPLPPLAEQHRIVGEVERRLSIMREIESEVDLNLRRARTLRRAVLAQAFKTAHAA
jgi:restriction endonuclease S subunit